jgi:hypothetical protein
VCGTGAGTGTEGSQPAQEGTRDFTRKATAGLRTEAVGVNRLLTWAPNRSNRYRFSPGSAGPDFFGGQLALAGWSAGGLRGQG